MLRDKAEWLLVIVDEAHSHQLSHDAGAKLVDALRVTKTEKREAEGKKRQKRPRSQHGAGHLTPNLSRHAIDHCVYLGFLTIAAD